MEEIQSSQGTSREIDTTVVETSQTGNWVWGIVVILIVGTLFPLGFLAINTFGEDDTKEETQGEDEINTISPVALNDTIIEKQVEFANHYNAINFNEDTDRTVVEEEYATALAIANTEVDRFVDLTADNPDYTTFISAATDFYTEAISLLEDEYETAIELVYKETLTEEEYRTLVEMVDSINVANDTLFTTFLEAQEQFAEEHNLILE